METANQQDLDRRVGRLERANRLLAGGLAVLAATLAAAAIRPPQAADLVQARRIQVVDEEGRVRMDLRHDEEETGLFILDESGVTRLGAAQFAHGGGGFALHGPDSKGAAVLYLKGSGSLTLYDAEGKVVDRFPPSDP